MKLLDFADRVERFAKLQHNVRDNPTVVIPVELGHPTMGGTPHVAVNAIYPGIDWDHGKIFIGLEKPVLLLGVPAAWQMRRRHDNWREPNPHPWEPCSDEQAQRIRDNGGASYYDVRALYAGPMP